MRKNQAIPDLTDDQKIRLLPWSIAHGAANAVFAIYTIFGAAFSLYLDELGLGKTQIGLLLSLLPLAGMMAPFIAPVVARAGFKRTFLVFWTVRKFIMALLLAAPWVLERWGPRAAFLFVAAVVLGFALCRAIAETAWYPWNQEVVPDSVRGRFGAASGIVTNLAMFVAILIGSYLIGKLAYPGGAPVAGASARPWIGRFQILIAVGVVFGAVCVWCAWRIPGGRPAAPTESAHWLEVRSALADRNFLYCLGGFGLVVLGTAPLTTFVPLYAKEQIGLKAQHVVLLDAAGLLGGLVSGYCWGARADRAGAKPVMLAGGVLTAVVSLGYLTAPPHHEASLPAVLAIAAFGGLAGMAWQIGFWRILYVAVVPPARKTQYMSVFYAWMGASGAVGPLAAGAALDLFKARPDGYLGRHPYVPVFAVSCLLVLAGALLLSKVREARPLAMRP